MRPSIHLVILLAAALGIPGLATAQATYNSVTLTWEATGDDSLTGIASQYDLRYSTSAITASNFDSATRWLSAPVPTSPGTTQSMTVTGLASNTTYWFAIKVADEVPHRSAISNVISRRTLVASDTIPPGPITNVQVAGSTENTLALRWTSSGDDGATGTAATYDVRYATWPITENTWGAALRASGEPAPAVAGTVQTFTIGGLVRQTRYYVALRVTDDVGNTSPLSNTLQYTTVDLTPPAAIRDLVPTGS